MYQNYKIVPNYAPSLIKILHKSWC